MAPETEGPSFTAMSGDMDRMADMLEITSTTGANDQTRSAKKTAKTEETKASEARRASSDIVNAEVRGCGGTEPR